MENEKQFIRSFCLFSKKYYLHYQNQHPIIDKSSLNTISMLCRGN